MISGGNATVYVANMDAAVLFYTDTLGLTLTNRFGNHWATLESAPGVAEASFARHGRRRWVRPGNV